MEGMLESGWNIVQTLRNVVMDGLGSNRGKRLALHSEARGELLDYAAKLERRVVTAHLPLLGLRIVTTPPGAMILVDGQPISGAVSPLTYVLPPHIIVGQEIEVTAVKPRCANATKAVTVEDAADQLIELTLEESALNSPGNLDVVLFIDRSGSMQDDAEMLSLQADRIVAGLQDQARQDNVTMQLGLVTYTRPDEQAWVSAMPLSGEPGTIQGYLASLKGMSLTGGGGGNEDIYAAMMFGMNERVNGQTCEMGWRQGAAKVAIPIGDEPASTETFTLDRVAAVCEALDPVRVYPIILPSHGPSWLDGTVRSMEALAAATGGRVIKATSSHDVPDALVAAIQLAIRRHKEEVWRKANPPYALYGFGGVIAVVVLVGLALLLASMRRRAVPASAPVATGELPGGRADPRLTGESIFRR
jgi:hypothetical protein